MWPLHSPTTGYEQTIEFDKAGVTRTRTPIEIESGKTEGNFQGPPQAYSGNFH